MTMMMMKTMRTLFIHTIKRALLALVLVSSTLHAQSIAEKKASIAKRDVDLDRDLQQTLTTVNNTLAEKRKEVLALYKQVERLYNTGVEEAHYEALISKIASVKDEIQEIKEGWREKASSTDEEEPYALWHQPETTLQQLVIDYGSQDFVYVTPPDVGQIKISVSSNIPIPRSAWNDMLEVILAQNGVGIRELSPLVKQLYLTKKESSRLKTITTDRTELSHMPDTARIGFLLTPEPTQMRRASSFLDKFVNPETTHLHQLGREILLIGQAQDISDLLKLYDFIGTQCEDKEYRLISLCRVKADDMQNILSALFCDLEPPTPGKKEIFGTLRVIPLVNRGQALFLIGTREEIRKAEIVIREVDCHVGDVKEKVVYWYTCKHSDPEELASVVAKIYKLMICAEECVDVTTQCLLEKAVDGSPGNCEPPTRFVDPGNCNYITGSYAVNPAPVQLSPLKKQKTAACRDNFIVDPKTSSIVMVVEAAILPKIQDLMCKLDVPKKMVQIEVLLFEKRVKNDTRYGLNLLKIGSAASNTNVSSLLWNDTAQSPFKRGILEFIFSRPVGDLAAFDLTYNFLLTRDDIQINASPSLKTLNQTPASISIVDDISINTGVFEVETNKGVTLKDSYDRRQYGIDLKITPTIHVATPYDSDPIDYITLETNVTFDTIQHNHLHQSRPDVTRRNIINEVRVADGQTVILGGLRKKHTHDSKEAIPFLGELPAIGKLFSINHLSDHSTEMFIFITPKIVHDPAEDMQRMRDEELTRRPGDIPGFLACLEEARIAEKQRLIEGTMQILFGRNKERYYWPLRELQYDCCESTY